LLLLSTIGCGTEANPSVSQPGIVEMSSDSDEEQINIHARYEVFVDDVIYDDFNECIYELDELSSDTSNDEIQENARTKEQVLEFFLEYGEIHFGEIENRNFEVLDASDIEDAYYRIIVNGILNDGSNYHIDTFAVNLDTHNFFIYHNESEQYIRYGRRMSYKSETSPAGTYRLEHGGAGSRPHQHGTIYTGTLRIICLDSGNILWSLSDDIFFRAHRIFWSEDGRFVAFDHPWIMYTDIMIIDTTTFSETNLIGLINIVDAVSKVANSEFCMSLGSDHHHTLVGWVDTSTVEVEFYWLTTETRTVRGTYQFNAITREVININIFRDEFYENGETSG